MKSLDGMDNRRTGTWFKWNHGFSVLVGDEDANTEF